MRLAAHLASRSPSAVLPSRSNRRRRAVSRSNSSSRCAGSRTIAAHPARRHHPFAARDRGHAMQHRCRIRDEAAGRQLEGFLARSRVDDQFAAVVGLRVRQEQRERHVGPRPSDQGVVDVRAVGVARLVAREQRADDGLGPGRQGKHGMRRSAASRPERAIAPPRRRGQPAGWISPVSPTSRPSSCRRRMLHWQALRGSFRCPLQRERRRSQGSCEPVEPVAGAALLLTRRVYFMTRQPPHWKRLHRSPGEHLWPS